MRWLIISLALLGFSFFSAPQTHAQVATGKIIDKNKIPQSSAQVQFSGPEVYLLITDANGEFYLENPREGTYRVTVIFGNHQQLFHGVRISGGTITPSTLVVSW